MSYKTPYSPKTSMSSNQAIKDLKRRSLLTDGSWIKNTDEDESVFNTEEEDLRPAYKTGSVGNLSKRFGGSQDFLDKSSKAKPSQTIAASTRFGGSQDFLDKSSKAKPSQTIAASSSTRFGGSQDFLDKSSKAQPSQTIAASSSTSVIKTSTADTKTITPGSSKPPLPTKPESPGRSNFTDRVFSANKSGLQRYSSPQSKTTTVAKDTTPSKEATNGVKIKPTSPIFSYNTKSSAESTPKSPDLVPTASTLSPRKSPPPFFSDETKNRSTSTTPGSAEEPPSSTMSESQLQNHKPSTLDDLADTLIPTPTQTVDSAPVKAASDSNTLESLADTLLPTTIQKETNGNSIPESKLDSLADTLDPFSSRAPDTLDPFSSRAPAPEKTLSSPLDSLAGTLLSTPTKSMNGSSEKSFTDSSKYSPGGTYISSSTSQSVRSPSKSTLADRNLCSFCHQSIVENTRMIVDELQIFSHAGCFKCAVCHCNLGNLEAGDSLWVYRSTVNCDGCYSKLRDRWFH